MNEECISKISVIIPIYKVEKYIYECVDSILAQTYKNLEIILVDDGSPDKCGEICDEYKKIDSRIKVIHKKNGGLSDARNKGIEVMTGDYVAFVDSDDYVDQNYIKELYESIIKNQADIAVCNYYKYYEDIKKLKYTKKILTKEKVIFNNIEGVKDVLTADSVVDVVTWNKLYKSELFLKNKLYFPFGKLHEDNFTTYKLLYFSDKIVFIEKPLYYYRLRSDSIMSSGFSTKRLDSLEAGIEIKDFIKKHLPYLYSYAEANYVFFEIGILNLLVSSGSNKSKNIIVWKKIKKDILKNFFRYIANDRVKFKQKICILISITGYNMYFLFWRCYKYCYSAINKL